MKVTEFCIFCLVLILRQSSRITAFCFTTKTTTDIIKLYSSICNLLLFQTLFWAKNFLVRWIGSIYAHFGHFKHYFPTSSMLKKKKMLMTFSLLCPSISKFWRREMNDISSVICVLPWKTCPNWFRVRASEKLIFTFSLESSKVSMSIFFKILLSLNSSCAGIARIYSVILMIVGCGLIRIMKQTSQPRVSNSSFLALTATTACDLTTCKTTWTESRW